MPHLVRPIRTRRARPRATASVLALLALSPSVQPQTRYPGLVTTWHDININRATQIGVDLVRVAEFFPPYPAIPNPLSWRFMWPHWGGLYEPVMDSNNEDFLIPAPWAGNVIITRLARQGNVTPVWSGSDGPGESVLVAPSGDYVFGVRGGLARIRPDGSGYRLILPSSLALSNLVWDEDTGDVIARSGGRGYIYRCRFPGTVTTLAPAPSDSPGWADVDYDPITGDFLGLTGPCPYWPPCPRYSGTIFRIPRAGGTPLWEAQSDWTGAGSLRIARNGDLYTVWYEISLARRDPAGNWIGQRLGGFISTPGAGQYTGLEIDRWRNVAGSGAYSPGSSYTLRLSFPDDSSMAYLGAASLSIRPGFQAGPHWIPLNADALFFASLRRPDVFQGFSGTLSSTGRATATFNIPAIENLRGMRIFFTFVTYDPRGGGIRTASNLFGITIGADI